MGWFSANVTYEGTDTKSDTNQYGTRTPNVSPEYTDAYNTFRTRLNPNGMNATQADAYGRVSAMPSANSYATTGNANLNTISNSLNRFTTQGPRLSVANHATYNAAGATPTVTAAQSAGPRSVTAGQAEGAYSEDVGPIAARTGADFMGLYDQDYTDDVVDTSLADYDYGAAEGFNALRAGSAGAFANKRTGVAEGQFMGDAARGRGALSANIRAEGFRTRAGLGQQDATRTLAADTTNADNLLRNRQFNAGLRTQNNQFNTGQGNTVAMFNSGQELQNNQFNAGQSNTVGMFNAGEVGQTNRFNAGEAGTTSRFNAGAETQNNQFNVDSGYRNDAQQIAALGQQAGLTQQQMDNLFTADGIDTDRAQQMFTAGTISQAQLQAILDAAREYNGSSYTDNRHSTGSTDTYGSEVGF